MIGEYPRTIYQVGKRILLASYGLDSDARALMEKVQLKLINHSEDQVEPVTIATVVSALLFDLNYICTPIIAGLTRRNEPFLCSMDGLGAQTISDSFCIAGTASDGLYAICEANFRPNLSSGDLVALVETCLREALQRDVLSGCRVQILTMLPEGEMYLKVFNSEDV